MAKVFLFRVIYRGSAYAFKSDPDFTHVSSSERWWQQRIDAFYTKYKGLDEWHTKLLKMVGLSTGLLTMPTGRTYLFERETDHFKNLVWPQKKIVNYPVQGLGAELMAVARVSLRKRLVALGLKSLLVCTVHDSVLIDALPEEVVQICRLIYEVFADIPRNWERLFGIPFDVKLHAEVQVGNTWADMVDVTEEFLQSYQGV